MKFASIVVLIVSASFIASVAGPAAFSDSPGSTVPKLNGSDAKISPAPRTPGSRTPDARIPLDVRVVLKADDKQGVAAKVLCIPLEMLQPAFAFVKGVSDERGDLHTTRTACPMLLRAETEDQQLGGIVQITADDAKVVIPVGPTTTLRGRLIDKSSGRPVVDQFVNCGVKAIYPPQRFSIWGFYNSARTDAQGKFTLGGLVPGWKFDFQTFIKPKIGRGTTWSLGAVTPRYSGKLDLGDIKLGTPDEPRRLGQPRPEREPIYNRQADAHAELDQALKLARQENKRVLVSFGGNWTEWCFKLQEMLTKNAEIAPIVKQGFVLVLVDANSNRKLLESYTVKDECRGFPFLTILDAKGNVLKKQNTDELEDGPKHDAKKVKAFLTKWSLAN